MSGRTRGAGRLPCKRNNSSNKKIKKERKFAMENECCFPMTATDRPVSEPSGFPSLEESRFAARNMQDLRGGVEGGLGVGA